MLFLFPLAKDKKIPWTLHVKQTGETERGKRAEGPGPHPVGAASCWLPWVSPDSGLNCPPPRSTNGQRLKVPKGAAPSRRVPGRGTWQDKA